MKIRAVKGFSVYDSRGRPTIRCLIELNDGAVGVSSVPSGASTGKYEALELRDNDQNQFFGLTVNKALNNINQTIASRIVEKEFQSPAELDQFLIDLDGTENKSNLGANAILAVSQAYLRALAASKNQPLWQTINEVYFPKEKPGFPRLMVNVINGGRHAEFRFDIQEFMFVPLATDPEKSVYLAAYFFNFLGKELKKEGFSVLVGDEGGYSPALNDNEQALLFLTKTAEKMGLVPEKDYQLALDSAASEFYINHQYQLKSEDKIFSSSELIDYYLSLKEKYPIFSLEDPLAEDDWQSFSQLTKRFDGLVVGDDLYTTNVKRIKKGIEMRATNAVLIKPNQIGTIKETIEAIKLAKKAGWQIIVSHRSGETEDSFIADLAYSAASDFIKTGSMSRSERLAKYNRLIEIRQFAPTR